MKRRTFIKSIVGLFAATQMPKVMAETHPRTLAAEKALERQLSDSKALASHPNTKPNYVSVDYPNELSFAPDMIKPAWYTDREGGDFMVWRGGEFHVDLLKQRAKRKAIFNNTLVHSFAFENPACGYGSYGRWDCINGVTTSVRAARRKNPNLLNSWYWEDNPQGGGIGIRPRLS